MAHLATNPLNVTARLVQPDGSVAEIRVLTAGASASEPDEPQRDDSGMSASESTGLGVALVLVTIIILAVGSVWYRHTRAKGVSTEVKSALTAMTARKQSAEIERGQRPSLDPFAESIAKMARSVPSEVLSL